MSAEIAVALKTTKLMAAAIAGLPLGLVAVAVGGVFITLLKSVGRNPAARDKLFPIGMLGFALTEAVGLFSLTVVFLILFGGGDAGGSKLMAAAVAGLPLGVVALSVGGVFMTLLKSVERNPAARDKLFPIGMLGFALTEAVGLFCLTVVFLILFSGGDSDAPLMAAAIAGLPLALVAWSVGGVFITLLKSVARNPSARDKLFPIGMLGFALTEAVGLFCLTVVFLILFS